jgi:tRNA(Ile)-lysidine synthetase-like protein
MRESAGADEAFVREFCAAIGVRLIVKRVQIDKPSEENARNARYTAFADAALECHADFIATGHTMDDQAETVLMNLCRGAGLKGLTGIPRTRGNIIRPLLDITRAEVEQYLRDNNLAYVQDETNLSHAYTRNRVRGIILPLLHEHVNAQAAKNIAKAAARLAEAGSTRTCPAAVKDAAAPAKPFPKVVITCEKPQHYTPVAICGILPQPIEIRPWRAGDRITMPRRDGTAFTQKLQDIFVNLKIPRNQRGAVPVITSAGKIALVLTDKPRIAADFVGTDTYIYIGG